MKTLVLLFIIFLNVLFSQLAFSQRTTEDLSQWKLYKEVSGLQIFSKDIGCHDIQNGIHEQYIVFQFINSTSETMSVKWQHELWYNDKCITCDKAATIENTFQFELEPEQAVEGNCDKTGSAGLKIFTHFIGSSKGSSLNNFEFKNLEISFK